MSYRIDLRNAARRYLEAAQHLDNDPPKPRRDVAGYLYGLAAELALKELMRQSGMRPLSTSQDKEKSSKKDPFFLHFPELRTALRDQAQGRYQERLLRYAQDERLMNQWDTGMRYGSAADVLNKPIATWAQQAKDLVESMGAL